MSRRWIMWVALVGVVGCTSSSKADFDDGGLAPTDFDDGGVAPIPTTGGNGIDVTNGVVNLHAPVSIANGGTGATTPNAAVNNLLSPQAGHTNHVLTTNATNTSWADVRAVLATGDDAGLVVKGTYIGTASLPPATGAGLRMMWYPQRAAFRAGYVDGGQWDDFYVGNYSTAMGYNTTASGTFSTAIGGASTASGDDSTAIGVSTVASGLGATALGVSTHATGTYASALGFGSTAGSYATALGDGAMASGQDSTAMGVATTASGDSSTAMGRLTTASGSRSTAIGVDTIASGDQSTAMGSFASTNSHAGSFVYGDSSTVTTFSSAANDEFAVRASGGYRLFSNTALTAGVTMGAGASAWSVVSDRNAKQDFRDVDGEAVLAKIASMSIQSWRYKAEVSRALHIGPVAQDFRAAFGLGDGDKTISTVDIDGVNMLAIQTLAKRSAKAEQKNAELERENAELRDRLSSLEQAVHRLEHVDGAVVARRATKR